jgi:hypothetical protein
MAELTVIVEPSCNHSEIIVFRGGTLCYSRT